VSGDALLTEVRRLAAGGRAHVESAPARFDADDWRVAEQTLAPEVAGRDGDRLVRAFERVASTDGSPTARGRAARLRGSYLSLRGRHEASLVPYETAEALLRARARDGGRVGRAGALLRLARYDEAGALLRKTRTAARRRGDVVLAAAADLNLGIAESEAGRPRRALAPLERALDAFRSAGIVLHAGLAEQSRGVALLLLDRFEDARCGFAAAS
jgi:tetratricopeptide (TPR) repeat protein